MSSTKKNAEVKGQNCRGGVDYVVSSGNVPSSKRREKLRHSSRGVRKGKQGEKRIECCQRKRDASGKHPVTCKKRAHFHRKKGKIHPAKLRQLLKKGTTERKVKWVKCEEDVDLCEREHGHWTKKQPKKSTTSIPAPAEESENFISECANVCLAMDADDTYGPSCEAKEEKHEKDGKGAEPVAPKVPNYTDDSDESSDDSDESTDSEGCGSDTEEDEGSSSEDEPIPEDSDEETEEEEDPPVLLPPLDSLYDAPDLADVRNLWEEARARHGGDLDSLRLETDYFINGTGDKARVFIGFVNQDVNVDWVKLRSIEGAPLDPPEPASTWYGNLYRAFCCRSRRPMRKQLKVLDNPEDEDNLSARNIYQASTIGLGEDEDEVMGIARGEEDRLCNAVDYAGVYTGYYEGWVYRDLDAMLVSNGVYVRRGVLRNGKGVEGLYAFCMSLVSSHPLGLRWLANGNLNRTINTIIYVINRNVIAMRRVAPAIPGPLPAIGMERDNSTPLTMFQAAGPLN